MNFYTTSHYMTIFHTELPELPELPEFLKIVKMGI